MAIEELEDPEDLLSQEEVDQVGEQETEIETEEIEKSSDPVALYLRDIGSVPLLTRRLRSPRGA
ncbi:MAG: sigma-70 factor domain-containing protein [Candidatus Binatia bacterium]